ncbi:MAG: P1 family peptidase [Phyllobacterium sp.]
MRTGTRNLITDVGGLRVGNSSDSRIKSGVTVVLCDEPATAAVQVLGGAPGTRETDLLEPHNTVEAVHAVALAGGSAFGLDVASGVQSALREKNIGFEVGEHRVPIVPAAILFDLANGGDKDWGRYPPYRAMGYEAVQIADKDFTLGSEGAGTGALAAGIKGGLGSASSIIEAGFTVGALVAVNAMGSVTVGSTRHFWASPFELDEEFGGLGLPHPMPTNSTDLNIKFRGETTAANTTIGTIATDAVLTKAQAKRLAVAAHDGYARAIWPAHTPFDGDLIFALATGTAKRIPTTDQFIDLCAAAASTMARAVARGVFSANAAPNDPFPVWKSLK